MFYHRLMPSRRLNPDTALEISLNGTARRLATEYSPMIAAVEELRELAQGRGDLLAKAAGTHLGAYLGSPGWHHSATPYAAALLIMAGADPDLVVAETDVVRGRAGNAYSR